MNSVTNDVLMFNLSGPTFLFGSKTQTAYGSGISSLKMFEIGHKVCLGSHFY